MGMTLTNGNDSIVIPIGPRPLLVSFAHRLKVKASRGLLFGVDSRKWTRSRKIHMEKCSLLPGAGKAGKPGD